MNFVEKVPYIIIALVLLFIVQRRVRTIAHDNGWWGWRYAGWHVTAKRQEDSRRWFLLRFPHRLHPRRRPVHTIEVPFQAWAGGWDFLSEGIQQGRLKPHWVEEGRHDEIGMMLRPLTAVILLLDILSRGSNPALLCVMWNPSTGQPIILEFGSGLGQGVRMRRNEDVLEVYCEGKQGQSRVLARIPYTTPSGWEQMIRLCTDVRDGKEVGVRFLTDALFQIDEKVRDISRELDRARSDNTTLRQARTFLDRVLRRAARHLVAYKERRTHSVGLTTSYVWRGLWLHRHPEQDPQQDRRFLEAEARLDTLLPLTVEVKLEEDEDKEEEAPEPLPAP
jgi:hypothetical protein